MRLLEACKQELLDTEFLEDVLCGLSKPQKSLPCKYFYDERGSELFGMICQTAEYYPTRTEHVIFDEHLEEIAKLVGQDTHVIEYGSGEGIKIRKLLHALHNPISYTPIDISAEILAASARQLQIDFPMLNVHPVCADYTDETLLPAFNNQAENRLIFFPGSTISNFNKTEALVFLKHIKRMLKGNGHLLIGVDLIKDKQILDAAYNDAKGVTADFNKNLLVRMNNELDATFDEAAYEHHAEYNEFHSRIEMHLVSMADQLVHINGNVFEFSKDETIHTENSYKYSIESFTSLAKQAGLEPVQVWTDNQNLFSVHLLVG